MRLGALLGACHPAPSAAVTAVAASLAAAVGQPTPVVVGLAAAVLAGQLSVGWLNDALDAPRDARVGRADKPVVQGRISRRATAIAAGAAAVTALALTALFGPRALIAHGIALVSAWSYDLGVKATAGSVLPYLVSFGLLPVIVDRGHSPAWLLAAAASLGAAAHFVNVLPDIDDDIATGVRGLPHRLGPRTSTNVAAVLVLATGALLAFGPPGAPSVVALVLVPVAAVVLLAGTVLGRRPGSRAAFAAILVVAVLDVVIASTVL